MATNDITELRTSPERIIRGRNWMQERRTYRVEGVPPSLALIRGAFPIGDPSGLSGFPPIGTHPTRDSFGNDLSEEYAHRGVILKEYGVPYWAPGSTTDSQVEAIYETSIDDGGMIERRVVWTENEVADSDTVFFDLLTGDRIPGGAQRRIGSTTTTGVLDGAVVTAKMQNNSFSVNEFQFRGWAPGNLLYTGAKQQLISGWDGYSANGSTEKGIGIVTMEFLGRSDGWKERRPILHPVGSGSDAGKPTGEFTEFTIYPKYSFQNLFVDSGFDPGT